MKLSFLCVCVAIMNSLSAIDSKEYEWLENSKNIQTQDWIKQQQSSFNDYISEKTITQELRESLKKLTNFDQYSIPKKINDRYFYTSKKPSDKQHKLFIQNGLNECPRVIFDPNSLDLNISIENFVLSPNGKYLAYSTSKNGSDWLTCHVMNMDSESNLTDSIEKIKFSPIVWSGDSKGFFYSKFEDENFHSIYYHALGSEQSEDQLIYQDPSDGSVGYTPFITKDNRYLVIDAFNGSLGPNSISLLDLESANSKPIKIIPCDGANYWFICSRDNKLYFLTNKDADFRKVIYLDITDKNYTKHDFIPAGNFLLENIAPIGDCFCVVTSENVVSKLTLFDKQGKFISHIPLPSQGKVSLNGITQNSIASDDEIFFSFTHFFQPTTIYHYQLGSLAPTIFKASNLKIDSSKFVMEQVFYEGKDGTKIPMFITYKKGIKLDGNNQTLLTAYGAYGYINYPLFNAAHMLWLDRGGILALANIRGGGEYGEKWHQEGFQKNKQNSFDDFITAAEWLIKNKYTHQDHLAVTGMSSGGLLVATSANQRPDLFKVMIVEAGLLDMLRFHLFTVGKFWINEHGNPDDPEDFAYLHKYSPCHNVPKACKFPSVLITASEDDDRVVPSHSYKYLAALKDVYKDSHLFLRLGKGLGHDSSKSVDWVNERADILTFIYEELKLR